MNVSPCPPKKENQNWDFHCSESNLPFAGVASPAPLWSLPHNSQDLRKQLVDWSQETKHTALVTKPKKHSFDVAGRNILEVERNPSKTIVFFPIFSISTEQRCEKLYTREQAAGWIALWMDYTGTILYEGNALLRVYITRHIYIIHDSQQPISPIRFLFLKLPPPPREVLLV